MLFVMSNLLLALKLKTKDGKRKKSDIPEILKKRGLPSGKIDEKKLALIKEYVKEGRIL